MAKEGIQYVNSKLVKGNRLNEGNILKPQSIQKELKKKREKEDIELKRDK